MEEKRTSVYEGNKRALVATILLIVLLFSASYAFFSNFNTANAISNIGIGNMANVTMVFQNTNDFDFSINTITEQSRCTDQETVTASSSTPGQGSVTVTNNSGTEDISCKYEIWYIGFRFGY